VVDGNLQSPSLHCYFAIDNRIGLAQALASQEPTRNFVRQVTGSNLWVLTRGGLGTDFRGLPDGERLRSLMADLRAAFEYVLVDVPPLSNFSDAAMFARLSDGVVLVLESCSTRRECARKAKVRLESAGVRVLGAVLNKRTFPIPQSLYDRL
jgi:Mrp family chromosome partitioning ATPase